MDVKYNEKYDVFVDTCGNIYSKDTVVVNINGIRRVIKGRKLALNIVGSGYLGVCIPKYKIKKRVHRIVADTFLPNPYNKLCVNHINGIRTDNRVENLEWVTHSENNLHSNIRKNIRRGVYKTPSGTFLARLQINGVYKCLGTYIDKEEAYEIVYNTYVNTYGKQPWSRDENV